MTLIKLPLPRLKSDISLEQTLTGRRSWRAYESKPLSLEQVGQILWAAQGLRDKSSRGRTAPSAGATYPLILYVVLPEAVHIYDPQQHALGLHLQGDLRRGLARASLEQYWFVTAGMVVVIAADFRRTTGRYGQRGKRYVLIEVGHAAENVFLQGQALGLGSVAVGAYDDQAVENLLNLPENQEALLLIPIGYRG